MCIRDRFNTERSLSHWLGASQGKGVFFEGRRSIKHVKTFSHSWAAVWHEYSGRSYGLLARAQPRSQSSSPILDVTSPVKLVGKVRRGRLANNGKSKMAAPRKRLQPRFLKKWKKASEIGWDSLSNVCHQIRRDDGESSFKDSFRVYTCYYRRSVISSFDCIKKCGFNSAQQIVASQECVHVPLNVPG